LTVLGFFIVSKKIKSESVKMGGNNSKNATGKGGRGVPPKTEDPMTRRVRTLVEGNLESTWNQNLRDIADEMNKPESGTTMPVFKDLHTKLQAFDAKTTK
jgi:hypothetical protein